MAYHRSVKYSLTTALQICPRSLDANHLRCRTPSASSLPAPYSSLHPPLLQLPPHLRTRLQLLDHHSTLHCTSDASFPPSAMANDALPLDQRQLSDLTDLEIADLTAQIKSVEASSRPLVGEVEALERLAEEYQNGTFLAKIGQLQKDGWTGLRRLRGDGDCFYRGEPRKRRD